MKGELEKRQSEVIAAMRFPLMVLLLFAHVLPMVSVPIEMNLSEMNIYHFISEGISFLYNRPKKRVGHRSEPGRICERSPSV